MKKFQEKCVTYELTNIRTNERLYTVHRYTGTQVHSTQVHRQLKQTKGTNGQTKFYICSGHVRILESNFEQVNKYDQKLKQHIFNPTTDPPNEKVFTIKNWRRPKGCAFLTFNIIYFYTFCENLGSLSLTDQKVGT